MKSWPRHRFFLRHYRGPALAYCKDSRGSVRTLAGHLVMVTFSYPDAVDAERERADEPRNWTPPLVRNRKTRQAMERQALHGSDYFKAGTRAEHRRTWRLLANDALQTAMTRVRLHVQRLDGINRLRGIHPRIVRHLLRLGRRIPQDLPSAHTLTLRGELHERWRRLRAAAKSPSFWSWGSDLYQLKAAAWALTTTP